ncbi:MAG TPA: NB-ARC domain-containing protein [Pirellulaceae bacterium]|nr:NB-ARC domain-containing protein [Pirellulaceae bacterium]
MTSVFLSYARADDGEPFDPSVSFVAKLHRDLVSQGLKVWFDRESMPSRNLTFHQEIRDALSTCDRLVLVMGPRAATSEYVRQEWQYAWFEAEKVVTPILRRGDYSLIPDELKRLHCEDFRNDADYAFHLQQLGRILNEPSPPLGKLICVPPLPPQYLSRSDVLEPVRKALRTGLDDSSPFGGTVLQPDQGPLGASKVVGLYGMGGIGKSVLANLLVRDRKIREVFPDGIVWIPLGSQGDLRLHLQEVCRSLGDSGKLANEGEGKARLKQLVKDKAVLLVLDNVWHADALNAFDMLGPRCRALVTTRDSGLLFSVGAQCFDVELLTNSDAALLLALSAGLDVDSLSAEGLAVLSECGRLPLALTLCGGMMRGGRSWSEILVQLRQARIDRIATRHSVEPHHTSVWQTIHVSVEMLPPDERARFLELGVFVADETPEAAITTLWSHSGGLSEWDAQNLLLKLGQVSLVQLTGNVHGSDRQRRVRLHDLVSDYVRRRVGDFTPWHLQLLEAYRSKGGGEWSAVPDDGYFRRHIPTHLARACEWSELWRLAADSRWDLLTRWTQGGESRQGLECLAGLFDFQDRLGRDKMAQAGLATQIARIYTVQGELAESERWLQRSLALAADWRGRRIRAIANHELGSIYLYRGSRQKARDAYSQALQDSLLPPSANDEAAANLLALATIELIEYRPADAKDLAKRAYDLASQDDDSAHRVAALRTMGIAERDLMEMASASGSLLTALEMAVAFQLRQEEVACRNALAWYKYQAAALSNSQPAEASQLFQLNGRQAEQTMNFPYFIESTIGLVWCALLRSDLPEVDSLLAAFPKPEDGPEVPDNLIAAYRVASAASAQLRRSNSDAVSLYHVAAVYAHEHAYHTREADALAGLGACYFQIGQPSDAEHWWRTAISVADSCPPMRRALVMATIERNRSGESVAPL